MINSDEDLGEVFLLLQSSIGILHIRQLEHHIVHRGLDTMLVNESHNLLEMRPRSAKDPSNNTGVEEDGEQRYRLSRGITDTPDDENSSVSAHGSQGLRQCLVAADILDDVETPAVGRELACLLTPCVGMDLVVDGMDGAERAKTSSLLLRGGRGYDIGTRGHGDLQRGDTHASSPLDQDPGALLDLLTLQPEERIPSRRPGAGQGRSRKPIKGLGRKDKGLLGEDSEGPESSVSALAEHGGPISNGRWGFIAAGLDKLGS